MARHFSVKFTVMIMEKIMLCILLIGTKLDNFCDDYASEIHDTQLSRLGSNL